MAVLIQCLWFAIESVSWMLVGTLHLLALIIEGALLLLTYLFTALTYTLFCLESFILFGISVLSQAVDLTLSLFLFIFDFPNNCYLILQFFAELGDLISFGLKLPYQYFLFCFQKCQEIFALVLDSVVELTVYFWNLGYDIIKVIQAFFDLLQTGLMQTSGYVLDVSQDIYSLPTQIWHSVTYAINSTTYSIFEYSTYIFYPVQWCLSYALWAIRIIFELIYDFIATVFHASYESLDFQSPKYKYKPTNPRLEYSAPDPRDAHSSLIIRLTKVALLVTVTFLLFAVLVLLYHMRRKVLHAGRELIDVAHHFIENAQQRQNNAQNDGRIQPEPHNSLPVDNNILNHRLNRINDGDPRSSFKYYSRPKQDSTKNEEVPSTSGVTLRSRSTSSKMTESLKRELEEEKDKQLCIICQDRVKSILIFPCKHLCVCLECVEEVTSALLRDQRRCPICRGKIQSYLEVYT